jgi:hypothetical protein
MRQNEQWFKDRIGKKIHAESKKGFTGEMEIEDEEHAGKLFYFHQKFQGYIFRDIESYNKPKQL